MKRLKFDYEMQIDYSVVVTRCHYTIKCIPESNHRQSIMGYQIEMQPESVSHFGRDGFGNAQIYGLNGEDHDSFYFHISGTALTGLREDEMEADEDQIMIFRHPHGYNKPGPKLRAYYESLKGGLEGLTDYDKAVYLMHALHRDYSYAFGVTDLWTGAEEAFALGKGVCQDYAHIFIALLQMAGIAARYVTGLLIGEGASHAWTEICIGNKWYGLDPTNDSIVSEDHIRIGAGRDAGDCMINRGIMHGGGLHLQTIRVSVREDLGE